LAVKRSQVKDVAALKKSNLATCPNNLEQH
jgi:hypothetical protein